MARRVAILCALLLAAPAGAEERPSQPAGGAYLELVQADLAALLAEADAAVRAGDFAGAAPRWQLLIDAAIGSRRDELIEVRPARSAPEGGASTGPEKAPGEAIYASLSVALRRRLAALPGPALRAYREHVDARAGALAGEAIAARDLERLERVVSRYLFSSAGVPAAIALGDLHLERGDLIGALSTFETASRVPGAAPELAARLAAARARLLGADRAAAAAPGAGPEETLAAREILAGGPRHVPLVDEEAGEPSSATGAVSCLPIPVPGGLVVVRPGRALLVRGLGGGAEGGPDVRALPAEAGALLTNAVGPFVLGGAASREVLGVAVEHSRFLEGDAAGDEPAGGAGRPRPPFRAPGAAGRGVAAHAYDLYAFDIRRDYRLIFTTGEARAFGPDAPWLATVEWTALPVLGPGLVFGAATARSGEPEVFAAAIEAAGRPRLRWRTFVCARAYLAPDGDLREGPPLEPALARALTTVAIDTGVGAIAAIDAHRGEILWLRRTAIDGGGGDRIAGPGEGLFGSGQVKFPPLAFASVGPEGAERRTAVFSPGGTGEIVALKLATGELAWRAAAEEAIAPIGTWRGLIVAVERGELALFDPHTGKRRSVPMPLPPAPGARQGARSGGGRARVTGRTAAWGDRIIVPLEGMLLFVRVEGLRRGFDLRPERADVDLGAARDVAVAGGALALIEDASLAYFVPPAPGSAAEGPGAEAGAAAPAAEGPGAEAGAAAPAAPDRDAEPLCEDALSVLRAYGAEPDEDLAEAIRAALGLGSQAEIPGASLGTDEEGPPRGRPRSWRVDRTGRRPRVVPAGGERNAAARLELEMDPATRSLRVRVEPWPPGD